MKVYFLLASIFILACLADKSSDFDDLFEPSEISDDIIPDSNFDDAVSSNEEVVKSKKPKKKPVSKFLEDNDTYLAKNFPSFVEFLLTNTKRYLKKFYFDVSIFTLLL